MVEFDEFPHICSNCGGDICKIDQIYLKGESVWVSVICQKCKEVSEQVEVDNLNHVPSWNDLLKMETQLG